MKIGFIGLGIMGTPMSKNIRVKMNDTELLVYDFNPASREELESVGARFADSSREVVSESEIIFSMVPTGNDVKELYSGFMEEIKTGKILVDMSTIEPEVSVNVAKQVADAGGTMLDAPVVKSKPAAIDGSLGIYVGGDKLAFETIKPILQCMGSSILYLGGNGSGLVMKICHNMLVGQIQNGVNEMISMAQRYGISPSIFKDAINAGGGSNFYLNTKYTNIEDEDFPVAFSVRNMNKDVHIAKEMADKLGLSLPGVDQVVNIYEKAMEKGLASHDFSASYLVVNDKENNQE